MPPFTIPTTSAADELEHLSQLRAERALAVLAEDADLVGDLDIDIAASSSAYVGLAVTEIATLRAARGARPPG